MLRFFLPTSDATRIVSDYDSVSSFTYGGNAVTVTCEFVSGRFANTLMWRPTTVAIQGNTEQQLYHGFLKPHSGTTYRVSFDLRHLTSVEAFTLMAVAPTTSASQHAAAASSASLFWLTLNPATKCIDAKCGSNTYAGAVQLQNDEVYRVEVEFIGHASTGEIKVWINDILSLTTGAIDSLHSLTMTASLWTYFGCRFPSYVGNLMIWDDSGTATDFKGFCGDITPIKLLPTADGSNSDGTVTGAATAWQAVSDSSGATYVSYDVGGDYNLYDFATLSTTGTIKAVVVVADGHLGGNGEAYLKGVCKSGAAPLAESAEVSTALTTYIGPRAVLAGVFTVDPNTGIAWDVAGVNAAEFGVMAVIP